MSEHITCPRRMSDWGPWPREEGLDGWCGGPLMGGAEAEYEGIQLRACNFCGSLDPEQFMALVEKGYPVVPTDKGYKVYLDAPAQGDPPEPEPDETPIDAALREWRTGGCIAKFYTAHLSPEQGHRFRQLYAEGTMKFGYPGHFYRQLWVPDTEPVPQ